VVVRETSVVPRQTPRAPGPDDWASERVRYERIRHGWSTAELARRVTDAGCKISQSSVWSVESGSPRRKVSAGEAVALAQVFGITLEELVQPPDDTERLQADLSVFHADLQRWAATAADLKEQYRLLHRRMIALEAHGESYERP
jgi:transcriptional regulator with XRE-family HTH domain